MKQTQGDRILKAVGETTNQTEALKLAYMKAKARGNRRAVRVLRKRGIHRLFE